MRGVGTPEILWIIASISANLLATTCSSVVLGEERRSDPAMGIGVALVLDDICTTWLIVGMGNADW